jgi:hypothetical protein
MTIFSRTKQSPNAFANEFAERLYQAYPGAQIKPGDGYALRIAHTDGQVVLANLHNHYAMAMQTTGEEREHVLRFAVQSAHPPKSPVTWDEAASKLLPAVRAASWVSAQVNLVVRPLAPHVVVAVAIDSEFSISYVSDSNLQQWGVSLADVWRVAYENLSRSAFAAHIDESNGVVMLEGMDGFSSSLMLLPPQTFAGSWGDDAVIVPVSRDEVFLFRTTDREQLNINLGSAIQMYAQDPRQLSPVPYVWGANGPSEWAPADGDPSCDVVALAQRILEQTEMQMA